MKEMKVENKLVVLFVAGGLAFGLVWCGPSYESVKPSVVHAPKKAKGTKYITLSKQKSYL